MVRVTNAAASRRRKNRIYKAAKGFVGDRKNHLRLTSDAVMRAKAYNYAHRKLRKREFRRLWTMRLNAAVRAFGLSYSRFIEGLALCGCTLNRKVLSELAIHDTQAFKAVVDEAIAALQKKAA